MKSVAIVSYKKSIIKVFSNRDEAFNWIVSEGVEDKKPENFYTYYVHNFGEYELYCSQVEG